MRCFLIKQIFVYFNDINNTVISNLLTWFRALQSSFLLVQGAKPPPYGFPGNTTNIEESDWTDVNQRYYRCITIASRLYHYMKKAKLNGLKKGLIFNSYYIFNATGYILDRINNPVICSAYAGEGHQFKDYPCDTGSCIKPDHLDIYSYVHL